MTTERAPRRAAPAVAAYKLWILAALLATYAAVLAIAFGSLRRPTALRAPVAHPAAPTTKAEAPRPARAVAKAPARPPRVRTRSS